MLSVTIVAVILWLLVVSVWIYTIRQAMNEQKGTLQNSNNVKQKASK